MAPAHVEPVVHVMDFIQFRTIDCVNDKALPRRIDTHDTVAWQWMAALTQIEGNAFGQAADRDGFQLAGRGLLGNLAGAFEFGKYRLQHFAAAKCTAPPSA